MTLYMLDSRIQMVEYSKTLQNMRSTSSTQPDGLKESIESIRKGAEARISDTARFVDGLVDMSHSYWNPDMRHYQKIFFTGSSFRFLI